MPIGSYSAFADIICELIHHRPTKILDLGVGFGINGAGIRNWLGNGVNSPELHITGVEGWPNYKSPLWGCYDVLHVMPIQQFIAETDETYDAVIMTDVIEHFDKDEGVRILKAAHALLNKNGVLYVSTPSIWSEQGAVHGNELERHRSKWSIGDFLPCRIIRNGYEKDQYGHQMVVVALHNYS